MTTMDVPDDRSFGEFYYRNCCGKPYARDEHWVAFFGAIADRLVADLKPARVLDAGCAFGLLVEALRARGVEAYGVDLSTYAIEHVADTARPYCRHGSITEPFEGEYDLIVTIEVLEHMPAADAERAIDNFCAHTGRVLFSSSPNDYREPTHVNVHPTEYWAEQFARRGFYRDVDFDASFVTPWAVLFRRSDAPMHRVVKDYERRFEELNNAAVSARGYAAELQDRVSHLEQRLARTEADLAAATGARAEQAQELARRTYEAELAREQTGAAQRTIADMERSVFWRLRKMYVRALKIVRPDAS